MKQVFYPVLVICAMAGLCVGFWHLWRRMHISRTADLAILITSCFLAPLLVFTMWWHLDTKVSGVNGAVLVLPLAICLMLSHGLAAFKKGHFRGICILAVCITIPCYLLGTSLGLFMAASLLHTQ